MSKLVKGVAILIALIAILLTGSRFWHGYTNKPQPLVESQPVSQFIDYSAHTLHMPEIKTAGSTPGRPVAAITSHHLPTAEKFIHEMYSKLKQQNPDIGTFVVVGPDHFEQCSAKVTTTKKNFVTPAGELKNDLGLAENIVALGVNEEDGCFKNEHSIGVQATFIKTYFPNSTLVPVLFSSAASQSDAATLARELARLFPNAVVICSTDFSHYQNVQKANGIDARTEKQLKSMETGVIQLEQVDSPASLAFTLAFVQAQKAQLGYLDHANSYDFTGIPDNTTGYFNVIYTH